MKRFRQLAMGLQEFNGLIARLKKEPTDENKNLLDECFIRLKQKVNEVPD